MSQRKEKEREKERKGRKRKEERKKGKKERKREREKEKIKLSQLIFRLTPSTPVLFELVLIGNCKENAKMFIFYE